MTRQSIAQTTRTIPLWAVGAFVMVSWMLIGPATAAAEMDEGCDEDVDAVSPAETAAEMVESPGTTPCEFSSHDSPSYNICFAANPRPVTALPQWLARYQAEQAADGVFDEIRDLYTDQLPSAPGLAHGGRASAPPQWVESMLEQLRDIDPSPGPMGACFEGTYDEHCHHLPSEAVLVTSGSVPPVHVYDDDIDVPPRREYERRSQSPLVQLRVGPSAGHDSPPDRPPPA